MVEVPSGITFSDTSRNTDCDVDREKTAVEEKQQK